MIPIKAISLIPIVAQKTGLPEDKIKKLIDFYYSKLKQNMTTFQSNAFVLEQFGKFEVMDSKLPKVMELMNSRFNRHSQSQTPKRESLLRQDIEDIKMLQAMVDIANANKQKKLFVKHHKKNNEGQNSQNLEG